MKLVSVGLATWAIAIPVFAQGDPVAHGDYIVNRVTMCGDCHSPRENRAVIVGKEFTGAPFPDGPPFFAHYAPSIRGLPAGFSQGDFITFLQTGIRPNGSYPKPPMPKFRLSEGDARAVAAYLASLKP